ncbi:MAG: peptide deformylase, partial [Candidatus Omnitrophota bacterium]
ILRKKTASVSKITDPVREILSEMAKVMYLHGGVGLAANQVGIDKQLIVIDIGDGLIKMVNPVIVKKAGSETREEGCLSCPDVVVKVKRAKKITCSYMDDKGEIKILPCENLLARAIQHETDHLAGKVILDYVNPIKKIFMKKIR